jgi:hypothetical protein
MRSKTTIEDLESVTHLAKKTQVEDKLTQDNVLLAES